MGCRCYKEFGQSSTGTVVINAVLPRRHCLNALKKNNEKTMLSRDEQHKHTEMMTTRGGVKVPCGTEFLKTTIEALKCQINFPTEDNEQDNSAPHVKLSCAPRVHNTVFRVLTLML